MVMTLVLFLCISVFGAMVLSGVLEEKSSRVVEVLLARIPARALLAGKIAGIGLLGLAQIGVTALAALAAITTVHSIDLPAIRGTVLAWAIVWFVLGYALYATVYGALGSLGSRAEDGQAFGGPVMVMLPLVLLAGRIYTNAILHGGPRLSLQDAWRSTTTPAPRPDEPSARATKALRHRALALAGGKTTMTKTDLTSHRCLITTLTAVGVALGAAVAVFTSDVIIGVIAGAGFIAIATQMVNLWTRHNGPPVTHH